MQWEIASVYDDSVRETSVRFSLNGLPYDNANSHQVTNTSHQNKLSYTQSPGSLSLEESVDDGSSRLHLSFGSDHNWATPATSLLECLAQLDDDLADSTHTDHSEVESVLTGMMEQAQDDVDSFEGKCDSLDMENAKSELNVLIDGVTELEEVTQKQHHYISTPSKHDFRTQLDNLNEQIDNITSPSAKLQNISPRLRTEHGYSYKIDDSNSLAGRESAIEIEPPADTPNDAFTPVATPKKAARNSYFFEAPTIDDSSNQPKKTDASDQIETNKPLEDKEVAREKKPADKPITAASPENNFQTSHDEKRSERIALMRDKLRVSTGNSKDAAPLEYIEPVKSDSSDLPKKIPSSNEYQSDEENDPVNKQILAAVPKNAVKTPHNGTQSERIASMKSRLQVSTGSSPDSTLEAEGDGSDISEPPSTESKVQTGSATNTPIKRLMIKSNPTKSAARKCYFYKSPRKSPRRKTKRSSLPAATSEMKTLSPKDIPSSSERKLKQIDVEKKRILHPRELKAYEKHVSRRKSMGNSPLVNSTVQKKERVGSSPQLNKPTNPRELKAIEKHVRLMRERMEKDNDSPHSGDMRKLKIGSAYERHIGRMREHKSPEGGPSP